MAKATAKELRISELIKQRRNRLIRTCWRTLQSICQSPQSHGLLLLAIRPRAEGPRKFIVHGVLEANFVEPLAYLGVQCQSRPILAAPCISRLLTCGIGREGGALQEGSGPSPGRDDG